MPNSNNYTTTIPISAELSLRYWHSKNNLHHYSTIYLSHHDTYDQWTYEHLHIQDWQPTLNWPYIQRHLHLKASGWQFAKHRTTFTRMSTHKRLFQRLRRCQKTIKQPNLHTSQRTHALTVLRELSKHTRSSFETATAIRSGQYTDPEIYASRRMAASLEEPDRSRVLHLIHSALNFPQPYHTQSQQTFHNSFSITHQLFLGHREVAPHSCSTPHAPRHTFPPTYNKTSRSSSQNITTLQPQTVGRFFHRPTVCQRHAVQLLPHAHAAKIPLTTRRCTTAIMY